MTGLAAIQQLPIPGYGPKNAAVDFTGQVATRAGLFSFSTATRISEKGTPFLQSHI